MSSHIKMHGHSYQVQKTSANLKKYKFLLTITLTISENNFTLIDNGIDINRFKFDDAVRDRKRKELSLEDNFTIYY